MSRSAPSSQSGYLYFCALLILYLFGCSLGLIPLNDDDGFMSNYVSCSILHRIPSSLRSPLFLVHSIARFGGVPLHGEALSMSGGLSVFELMIFSVESSLTVHCEMADILGHSLCGRHRTMMRREQAE